MTAIGGATLQFQFVEHSDDAATTNGVLAATSGTPIFKGTYTASATVGPYLTPTTTGSTGLNIVSDMAFNDHVNGSVTVEAGYIGTVGYYQQTDTPLTKTAPILMPSSAVTAGYSAIVGVNNSFNSAVNTYNPLKDAYNKAVKDEKDRIKNKPLDKPITIPQRPCPPSTPVSNWFPSIDMTAVTDFAAITDANKALNKAGLIQAGLGFNDV